MRTQSGGRILRLALSAGNPVTREEPEISPKETWVGSQHPTEARELASFRNARTWGNQGGHGSDGQETVFVPEGLGSTRGRQRSR